MKKLVAIILSGLMVCSLAACGQSNSSQTSETSAKSSQTATEKGDVIAGGYTDAESPVVTDEIKALLAKASEGLTGVGYEPVAYIGTQVVAGTNHLILCKVTPVVPDAKTTYALVTVYEDLNGNAEITDVQDCAAEAPASDSADQTGAYVQPENPAVTDEARSALNKAVAGLDGAAYEVKAVLGTQVVAGVNYQLFCKVTPVTENAASYYAVVTVYEDLEGNAEITQTDDFGAAANAVTDEPAQAEASQG